MWVVLVPPLFAWFLLFGHRLWVTVQGVSSVQEGGRGVSGDEQPTVVSKGGWAAGVGLLWASVPVVLVCGAAQGVRHLEALGRSEGAQLPRVHEQRRRSVPQGRCVLLYVHLQPQGAVPLTKCWVTGFDENRVTECHGSIHHLQCCKPGRCSVEESHEAAIWDVDGDLDDAEIDETSFHLISTLPTCKHCDRLARPNILMFGDSDWVERRTLAQETRFDLWQTKIQEVR